MTDFEKAQASFLKAQEAKRKTDERFTKAKLKRDAACPHNELIPREYYFSGSYNDQAYSDYWNECAICGKCSERTTERHSCYG